MTVRVDSLRDIKRRMLQRPTRIIPLAFLAAIAVSTAMMMLPAARAGPGHAPFLTALFTATSAICTTGLTVKATSDYWSGFGHAVIAVITQIGGFGIMTMAILLTLLASKRLGLHNRLVLQAESAKLGLADTRRVLARVALTMLGCEAAISVIVGGRLWLTYHYPAGRAAWYGVFHAVQAFNNSGFSLFKDGIKDFVGDAWICLPLTFGVIIGSTGFPVLFELRARWRQPTRWSTDTRLTVGGTLVLLTVGFLAMLAIEWTNPKTLGPLGVPDKALAAFVQGTISRSGGLNSLDFGAMRDETGAITVGLMFIGGGSASTAGGIKVTTFFLLAFVIWAELRGEPDVVIGRRRIASTTQRKALTIALLAVGLVMLGTLILLSVTTGLRFYHAAFEATSALSTAGLSTGATPGGLPADGQVVLIILMFVGRVGTIVTASALALKTRQRLYRYPEEQPIVG